MCRFVTIYLMNELLPIMDAFSLYQESHDYVREWLGLIENALLWLHVFIGDYYGPELEWEFTVHMSYLNLADACWFVR